MFDCVPRCNICHQELLVTQACSRGSQLWILAARSMKAFLPKLAELWEESAHVLGI